MGKPGSRAARAAVEVPIVMNRPDGGGVGVALMQLS